MELSTNLVTLGDRLKATRIARRLTRSVVAKQLGISHVSLNSWERNKVKSPEIIKLLAFTRFCDINLEWLVDGTGDHPDFVKTKSRPIPHRGQRLQDEMMQAMKRQGFIEGWKAAMRYMMKGAQTPPPEVPDL